MALALTLAEAKGRAGGPAGACAAAIAGAIAGGPWFPSAAKVPRIRFPENVRRMPKTPAGQDMRRGACAQDGWRPSTGWGELQRRDNERNFFTLEMFVFRHCRGDVVCCICHSR